MPTMLETDLKEVLEKIDRRLNAIESDLTTIKVDLATVKVEVGTIKEDVKELNGSQRAQIWALIITMIGATTAAVIKFGFFPNP